MSRERYGLHFYFGTAQAARQAWRELQRYHLPKGPKSRTVSSCLLTARAISFSHFVQHQHLTQSRPFETMVYRQGGSIVILHLLCHYCRDHTLRCDEAETVCLKGRIIQTPRLVPFLISICKEMPTKVSNPTAQKAKSCKKKKKNKILITIVTLYEHKMSKIAIERLTR